MTDSAPGSLPQAFHPLVRSWFARRYGEPTPVQVQAWPLIAGGGHVLASAPTGSGKTLTAFLGALSRFASGDYPENGLSVLYISPLKALNEDVRLNLVAPSRELAAWFAEHGERFPRLKISSRSGDTPQSERRSMLSNPPAILCTTPESLAILLSSRSGLGLLSAVRLVILDEVHAVLGTKRGASLACSVGRLALLAGEFQRVALSATVKPFEEAARFVGGCRLVRDAGGRAAYERRDIAVVAPPSAKRYELSVAWPAAPFIVKPPTAGPDEREADEPSGRYDAVVGDLAGRVGRERATIVFADSRRRVERLAAMLNDRSGEGTAWAHHGSLSKEVRKAVETRLKEGRLKCVVATGTLELGIDVGSVDLVALAGAPSRADQLLQRAGRSGHGVGLSSRAVIYPFHGLDLLTAAASVGAALEADIDPVRPPREPLDVLAQALLSMALFEERSIATLFDEILSFPPFERLSRPRFDAVVGMLAGRYEGSRVKELAGRVYLDAERGSIRAKEGAARLLYASGGSIPDRGYYAMRLAGDGGKIGELDEEFVFERRVGNSFAFGSQAWRIVEIGEESVTVAPLDREADFMPFWKAEKAPRGASVSKRMLALCAGFQADPEGFSAGLEGRLGFSAAAARALVDFLAAQARSQGAVRLPGASVVPVELFRDPAGKAGSTTVILHTLRGAPVNEPLGLALSAALEARLGLRVDRLTDDDSVSLALPLTDPSEAEAAVRSALAELATPGRLVALLRTRLLEGAAFGAAFRENAGRALLLPRQGFGKRTPLWMTRLKAKRLFEKTSGFEDFPIVEESVKCVLEGRFELGALAALCEGLGDGSVELGFFSPRAPSPLARQAGWAETSRYLYDGDEMRPRASGSAPGVVGSPDPGAGAGPAAGLAERRIEEAAGSAGGRGFSGSYGASDASGLSARPGSYSDEAIAAAVLDARARPDIPPALALEFGRKLRRELPGWAPETPDALADWVDERVAVPLDEWRALLECCPAELASAAGAALPGAAAAAAPLEPGLLSRLEMIRLPGASADVVARRERAAALLGAGSLEDKARLAAEWLRSTGLETLDRLRTVFGFDGDDASVGASLSARGCVLVGSPLGARSGIPSAAEAGSALGFCDRDNLESLLRLARKAARPIVKARPATDLPSFLAAMQGLRDRRASQAMEAPEFEAGVGATRRALSRLSGYPAPASLWETEILPARVPRYSPEYLDAVLESGDFVWFGAGSQTVAFVSCDEFEAFWPEAPSRILAAGAEPIDAWAVKDRLGVSIAELEETLWAETWAGAVSSDGFEAVRRAAASGFKRLAARDSASGSRPAGRPGGAASRRVPLSLRGRWKTGAPLPGRWFSLSLGPEADGRDEADRLELATIAARAAARRWGLVCKATLERELPTAGWAALSKALRRLELSGELSWGRFFEGLDGPQFMSAEGLALFRDGGFKSGLYGFNACDPASPSGLPANGLPDGLPSRLPVNRMVISERGAVCVSRRSWRELDLALEPDAPGLEAALDLLVEARRRTVDPERRVAVATINGESAASSPYAPALSRLGFEADRGVLTLW